MIEISEYDAEILREKEKECKKRNGECSGCPYEEACEEEELLNSLDEW